MDPISVPLYPDPNYKSDGVLVFIRPVGDLWEMECIPLKKPGDKLPAVEDPARLLMVAERLCVQYGGFVSMVDHNDKDIHSQYWPDPVVTEPTN